ncbi:uncharacterized protein FIBRA_01168 [Fibroporia radiculosa]|uniref:Uncharacterized protein n=1 Tax=Fibroporia radiculosa TaxID=599839 RepID=J4G0U3_9APHY|nr:uncharacterized protein FIBRA_01168 [Fibroporia radiculosa]CCL99153.1 predicted protein [Fibroporia radiculosa]
MNYNTAHDNFVLVAPRPVRLANPSGPTPYTHFQNAIQRPQTRVAGVRLVADGVDRIKLGEDVPQEDLKPPEPLSEREHVSPRASPRSGLSPEALEEFLSILQSSTLRFPPTSPILRSTNANAPHSFFYRRATPCSLSPSHQAEGLGLSLADPADEIRKESTTPAYPFKFIGGPLASPVSRTQTRNPFQRHPSYDTAFTGLLGPLSLSPSPSLPVAIALSPSTVPLPLPTPDEVDIETSS